MQPSSHQTFCSYRRLAEHMRLCVSNSIDNVSITVWPKPSLAFTPGLSQQQYDICIVMISNLSSRLSPRADTGTLTLAYYYNYDTTPSRHLS